MESYLYFLSVKAFDGSYLVLNQLENLTEDRVKDTLYVGPKSEVSTIHNENRVK